MRGKGQEKDKKFQKGIDKQEINKYNSRKNIKGGVKNEREGLGINTQEKSLQTQL